MQDTHAKCKIDMRNARYTYKMEMKDSEIKWKIDIRERVSEFVSECVGDRFSQRERERACKRGREGGRKGGLDGGREEGREGRRTESLCVCGRELERERGSEQELAKPRHSLTCKCIRKS